MTKLGDIIANARRLKGWSLAKTAEETGISAAYLHKLENNDVQEPSPTQLHKLAEPLDLPYGDLMRLAGYVVEKSQGDPAVNALATALRKNLQDEDIPILSEFLEFHRFQQKKKQPSS